MIEFFVQSSGDPAPWFEPQAFGTWFGALGGGIGGALLGVLGAIAGVCAPRGRARALVLGGFLVFIVLGAFSLVAGLTALASGQPQMIWQPLLLVGAIFSGVGTMVFFTVRRRYAEAEQRHMHAADLRSS